MSREANAAVLALARKLAALSTLDHCPACRRLWVVHDDAQLRSCAIRLRYVSLRQLQAELAAQVKRRVDETIVAARKGKAA